MPSNSQPRQPRLRVLANGTPLAGAERAHVTTTAWYGADTFSVSLATSADPAYGPAFWARETDIAIDVAVDLGAGFVSLIEGTVDHVVLDPAGGSAQLSGRDRSAELIEAATRETFANQTASDIAASLAARRGLRAVVRQTRTPVGRYWQLGHDRLTLDQFARATTEWDLLAGLAEREAYDLWVRGDTLYFQPRSQDVAPGAVLRPVATAGGPANVTALRLERAHTLARGMSLTVRSWSSRSGASLLHTVTAAGSGRGSPRAYNFVLPDLAADIAAGIAAQRLAELLAHERVVIAEMPGETAIDAHGAVRLEGTGTDFDQDYRVDEIARSFDARFGFRQTLRARAASSDVVIA